MSTNPYDALRKVINHESNQDDDGGFFAQLGGLEPDHAATGHTLGLLPNMDLDRDGAPVYAAKPGQVQAAGWNATPSRSWNPALGQYPPWYAIRGGEIRTCKVWKKQDYDIFARPNKWLWQCRLCNYQGSLPTWELAYATANRHARNHHRDPR